MDHVPPRSFSSPAACPVALLAALLACAGPAHAQQAPPREPSAQGQPSQFERDLKQAEDHDPSSRRIVRAFKGWAGLVIVAMVVVPVVLALKAAAGLFTRMRATTDPEKLALSDPWVRAHLARRKADGDAPPAPDR
jgi:hypothetical protein